MLRDMDVSVTPHTRHNPWSDTVGLLVALDVADDGPVHFPVLQNLVIRGIRLAEAPYRGIRH
jgi:hypothetical protein